MGKQASPPADNTAYMLDKQGQLNKDAVIYNDISNRPNQSSPIGDVTWERTMTNPYTGQVYDPNAKKWLNDGSPVYGNDKYEQDPSIKERGYSWDPNANLWRKVNPDYVDKGDVVNEWQQTTTLSPEYDAWINQTREQSMAESRYRQNQANEWGQAPGQGGLRTSESFGTTNPTTGTNDWRQFGSTANTIQSDDWREFASPNQSIGADDWREFSSPETTIGADDWREFGDFQQTIGADDWRQFGTTQPILDAGSFDERFGNAGDHGYGDHDMGPGDWDYVNYEPEFIRNKAYNDMYAAEEMRLDPQYETQLKDMETQMRAQGLQPGDQQWESRMQSYGKTKNDAYEMARLNATNSSRAEAAMLWDQEMGRSQQKNQYHQADIDNQFQARQGNIQNYLSGRQQDMQGYLDYSNSAFNQDMSARQQQLDANLDYGRESWNQDYNNRRAQIDSNLAYGQQAFQQDYMNTQADRQSNLDYGNSAYEQQYRTAELDRRSNLQYGQQSFQQDFQRREAEREALLNYGNQSFNQDLQSRQQEMDAYAQRERLANERYSLMNPESGMNAVGSVLG